MWAFVYDVQLLDGYLVDLIQHIDARNIDSVALDHINQLINCRVASDVYVGIGESVLMANSFDCVIAHVGQFESERLYNVETTFFLSLNHDVGWLLVESHTEAFQLVLNLSTMR